MRRTFLGLVEARTQAIDSLLCIGLDPPTYRTVGDSSTIEQKLIDQVVDENLRLIGATARYAAAYKPNVAYYEALGPLGAELLARTIASVPAGVPVILDAKRGDVGHTAYAYAAAANRLGVDAVTVSPYLGTDAIAPYLENPRLSAFVLIRTSNRGAEPIQDVFTTGVTSGTATEASSGKPFYLHVAETILPQDERIGMVVGATMPEAMHTLREAFPDRWILAPGVGPQGGDLSMAVRMGVREDGRGLLIASSRSVAAASDPAAAARSLRDAIRRARDLSRRDGAEGRPQPFDGDASWMGHAAPVELPGQSSPPPSSEASPTPQRETPSVAPASDEVEVPGVEVPGIEARKRHFVELLFAHDCIRFGSYRLKSGTVSPFYIDLRRIISVPELFDVAVAAYLETISGLRFDAVAGVPTAGLAPAAAVARELRIPMVYPRLEAKGHGSGARVEGFIAVGGRALLIDDLVTTGGSKIDAAGVLRDNEISVDAIAVLIERGYTARSELAEAGLSLHAYIQIDEVFGILADAGHVDQSTIDQAKGFLGTNG